MSRTFRRKNETKDLWWVLTDCVYHRQSRRVIRYNKSGKEAKIALAKYRSDAYVGFREPGPTWFRNMFVERPQRRQAKEQLRKFILDTEYVVLLRPKNKLKYWT